MYADTISLKPYGLYSGCSTFWANVRDFDVGPTLPAT